MSSSTRKQLVQHSRVLISAKDELESANKELQALIALDNANERLKNLAINYSHQDLENSSNAANIQISKIKSQIKLESDTVIISTMEEEKKGWERELKELTAIIKLKKSNEDQEKKSSATNHEKIALWKKIVADWEEVVANAKKKQEEDEANRSSSIIKLDRYVGGFKDSRSVLYYMLSTFAFLFDVVSGLVSNILKPIKYITTGVTGLWDSYMAYRDKAMDENRKYFMSTMLGGLIDIAVALTMFAAAVATIAAPVIVIPVMLSVSLVMGLVNASAATDIYRKKVKEAKSVVAQVEQALKSAEASGKAPNVIANLKIELYNAQQVRDQARNDRFLAKRTLGLSVFSSAFGVLGILALAAVFSNPFTAAVFAIAATVGFAVLAVVDVADKRNNNKFTRAISRLGSRIKKWWRGDSEADKKPHVDLKEKVEQRQSISVVDVPPVDLKHSSSEKITLKIAGGDKKEAKRSAEEVLHSFHSSHNTNDSTVEPPKDAVSAPSQSSSSNAAKEQKTDKENFENVVTLPPHKKNTAN